MGASEPGIKLKPRAVSRQVECMPNARSAQPDCRAHHEVRDANGERVRDDHGQPCSCVGRVETRTERNDEPRTRTSTASMLVACKQDIKAAGALGHVLTRAGY